MDFETAVDQSFSVCAGFGEARRLGRVRISRPAVGIAAAAVETLFAGGGTAIAGKLSTVLSGRGVPLHEVAGIAGLTIGLYLAMARSWRLYDLSALLTPRVYRVAVVVAVATLLLTANLFVLKAGADVSRAFIGLSAVALLLGAVAARVLVALVLPPLIAAQAISGRRIVLAGTDEELATLDAKDLFRRFGVSEIGRVMVSGEQATQTGSWERLAAEAIHLARVARAGEIMVATPWGEAGCLMRLQNALRASPLPVRLLPDRNVRSLLAQHGPEEPLNLVHLQRAPMTPVEQACKRSLDLTLAVAALVSLAPLLAFLAVAIKLDTPGPVIFRQRRNGFNQREFVIWKFRTMRVLEDSDIVPQARRDDARITRVGRLMRKTSLDELPQIINVLRGDMSIVGPRPHALAHDARYQRLISDYCMRHHMKPGITGWAQISGLRGETRETEHMQRRVEHDIWYIDNWSLGLDLRIILRTCREVLGHDAY